MTTTDRRLASDAEFHAEMARLDRLEVADPWRDQIEDVLHDALCDCADAGTGFMLRSADSRKALDALAPFLKPAPGTDSSGRQPWRWHREPGTGDEWDRVWKCCEGPYDEAPAGHYADCPGTDSSGQAVQRVLDLADELETGTRPGLMGFAYDQMADRIRAAVAGPPSA